MEKTIHTGGAILRLRTEERLTLLQVEQKHEYSSPIYLNRQEVKELLSFFEEAKEAYTKDVPELLKDRKVSVLRLDKNFHVYVHGNHEEIESKEDEKGTFLKLYYKTIE